MKSTDYIDFYLNLHGAQTAFSSGNPAETCNACGGANSVDFFFREVQKVWRNTTQPACGLSGFYEQIVPLVRAINQKLPREKALRILGGDPPFDWDQIKNAQDLHNAVLSLRRDTNIASVIEKEVLARHRKALMFMGTFHLVHGVGAGLVICVKGVVLTPILLFSAPRRRCGGGWAAS